MQFLLEFPGELATLVFVIAVLAVIFGFVLAVVYLEHRKEMALIEAGAYEQVREDGRAWILAGGLLLLAVGIGTVLESLFTGAAVGDGITVALVGVAALVYYWLKRGEPEAAAGAGDTGRSA
jgi:isoprenylcysteine carboxyl methyltransferase (ICMT) family protein YpbQ